MRNGKKFNQLGRKTAHRKAMLANMASSLIKSDKKRVITTLAKAKALRVYIEPLVTKSRDNTTHSRRTVFAYLQDKEAVNELFGAVATKIGDRPGGYTRILKLGTRQGDSAEMALIEFVDFNEFIQDSPKKKKSRRGKSSTKPKAEAPAAKAKEVVETAVVEEAPAETAPEAQAEDAPATEEGGDEETASKE
ncbi:MAG: 50S ribosomal protein L17 [Bacteroidia bacterium]|nr:50S ribosomal protein L17 [Bacteroidia bacterium]